MFYYYISLFYFEKQIWVLYKEKKRNLYIFQLWSLIQFIYLLKITKQVI